MNNENLSIPQPKPVKDVVVPVPPILEQGLLLRSSIRVRRKHHLSILAIIVLINISAMIYFRKTVTRRSFRDFMLSIRGRSVNFQFDLLSDRGLISSYKPKRWVCYCVTELGEELLRDLQEDYEVFLCRLYSG